jgi:hypothetical protein
MGRARGRKGAGFDGRIEQETKDGDGITVILGVNDESLLGVRRGKSCVVIA